LRIIIKNIVAEYVSFDPWNLNPSFFSEVYSVEQQGKRYCVDLEDNNILLNQFHSTRRRQVRKSRSYGCRFVVQSFDSDINDFLDLHQYTVQKHNCSKFYQLSRKEIEKYRSFYSEQIFMLGVEYNGKIVGSEIAIGSGDIFHLLFISYHPDYLKFYPSALLEYEGCMFAQNAGYKYLDFGGAKTGSGLEMHKKLLVSPDNIFNCYIGKRIRNQVIYDELINLNGRTCEGRFPEYARPEHIGSI